MCIRDRFLSVTLVTKSLVHPVAKTEKASTAHKAKDFTLLSISYLLSNKKFTLLYLYNFKVFKEKSLPSFKHLSNTSPKNFTQTQIPLQIHNNQKQKNITHFLNCAKK